MPVFKGSSTNQTMQNVSNIPMINMTLTNSIYLSTGSITLLKQYNVEFRNQFIGILSQYVRSAIALSTVQRVTDLPIEISKLLSFLEEFVDLSNLNRKVLRF